MQQSRFIALVDNWERLQEVSTAAQDSEDAGLLQYSKTLDSLDNKINNIKTSFQQFYMSIFNGPVIGALLTGINNIIKGLNRLGATTGIFNMASIILGVKNGLKLIGGLFSNKYGGMVSDYRAYLDQIYNIGVAQAKKRGYDEVKAEQEGARMARNGQGLENVRSGSRLERTLAQRQVSRGRWAAGFSIAGAAASALGTVISANDTGSAGAWVSGLGNTLSGVGQGLMLAGGNPIGGVIGGLVGALGSLPGIIEGITNRTAREIERLEGLAQEANIKRAEAKAEAQDLESTINNLKTLEEAQYDSAEAQQAYIDACNEAFEKFPQLASEITSSGDAIISIANDAERAELLLADARKKAADAALNAAAADLDTNIEKEKKAKTDYNNAKYATNLLRSFNKTSVGYAISDLFFEHSRLYPNEPYITADELINLNAGRNWLTKYPIDEVARNLAINAGVSKEQIIELSSKPGSETWIRDVMGLYHEKLKELEREAKVTETATKASQEATIYSQITSSLEGARAMPGQVQWEKDNKFFNLIANGILEDIESNMSDYILEDGKVSKDAIKEKVESSLKDYNETYKALVDNFKLDDFYKIVDQAESGKISLNEYASALGNLLEGNDQFKASLINDLEQRRATTNAYLAKSKFSGSWGEVTEGKNGEKLFSIVDELAPMYQSQLVEFDEYITSQLESGKIYQSQGNAIIEAYKNMILNASAEVRAILFAGDWTSLFGITEIQNELEKAGLSEWAEKFNTDFATIIANSSYNMVTEVESFMAKAASQIDGGVNALQKAQEGLNGITELNESMSKLGTTVEDYDIGDDGKIYLKDLNKARESLYANQQRMLENAKLLTENDGRNEAVNFAATKEINERHTLDELFKENWSFEEKRGELIWAKDNAHSKEEWDTATMALELFDAFGKRYLDSGFQGTFSEFLTSLAPTPEQLKELEGLNDFYEKYKAWHEENEAKETAKENRIEELEKLAGLVDEASKNKTEAFNTLISKGLVGYTPEEIQTLEDQLGIKFKPEDLTERADGTFSISKTAIDALEGVNEVTRNAINSTINSTAQQATESLKSASVELASGEKVDFSEFIKNTIYTNDQFNKSLVAYYQGTSNGLLDSVDILASALVVSGQFTDVNEALEALKEGKKIFTDSIDENLVKYLELSIKELEGTLTDEEKTQFAGIKDTDLGLQWVTEIQSSLVNYSVETFGRYGQIVAAALGADLNWSQIESIVKQGVELQLEDYLEANELKSTKQLSLEKSIIDSAGEFTTDTLIEMFYYAAEQNMKKGGEALNVNDYFDAFKYQDDGTWIRNAQVELGAGYEAITGTINQSTNLKALNEAIEQENLTESLSESFAQMFSNIGEVTISQIQKVYDSFMGEGSFAQSGLLTEIQNKGMRAVLEKVYQAAIENTDIESQSEEINAQIADIQRDIINQILSNIEAAFSGTISSAGLVDLSKELGLNLQGKAFQTLDGWQLTESGMLEAATKTAKKYGDSYEVVKKLADVFTGENGPYNSYQDLIDAAEHLEATEDITTGIYQQQYNLLKKMAAIRFNNAEDARFNFMEQDPANGQLDAFDNFLDQIDKVKSAFSSLSSGQAIGYKDFYNMMDFMESQIGWDNLRAQLGATSESYEEFVNGVVSASKELGTVDVDALMDLGVSVDSMQQSMGDSIKKVADEQINYLKGVREMLVALQALSEIGNIDIGLGFNLGSPDGEKLTLLNLDQILSGKKIFKDGKEVNVSEIAPYVDDKVKQILKPIIGAITGYEDKELDNAVGEAFKGIFGEGFSVDNIEEILAAQNFGQLTQVDWEGFTEGQLTYIAEGMQALNLKDEEGKLVKGWQNILLDYFNGLDFSNIPEAISQAIRQNLLNNGLVESISGNVLTTTKELTDDIKDKIIGEFEKEGQTVELVELGKTASGSFQYEVVVKNPTVEGKIEDPNIVWEDAFKNDSAEQTVTLGSKEVNVKFVLDGLGNVTATVNDPSLAKEQAEAAIKKAANNIGMDLGDFTTTVDAKGNHTTTVAINTQVDPVAEANLNTIQASLESIKGILNSGLTFKVEGADQLDAVKQSLDAILSAYSSLAAFISSNPLNVNVSNGVASNIEFPTQTGDGTSEITQIVNLKWNPEEFPEAPAQTVNITYSGDKYRFADARQTIVVDYQMPSTPLTATSSGRKPNLPPLSSTPPRKGEVALMWSGNVNDVSGRALAMGNLKAGARLANKTLVGELGPELAVYKGQYHLLGQDGAEFVDLPKDAIVFNHKQTNGIIKGQVGYRGQALAEGNVTGPAMAGGGNFSAAIAAIDRAISVWTKIANMSVTDMLGGSGGGGGGGGGKESIKAVTAELQEWYNLTRQIADLEQEINNIIAERENMINGGDYVRSLREQQSLLQQQLITQGVLLDYQALQLKRQADHINTNDIWSRYIKVDENGLLQYLNGNELNGGKGALEILQNFNTWSGEEQMAYLRQIGYSYIDQDGNALEGEELIQKFFEEFQRQIDEYDALRDTVHGTEETMENLKRSIEEINEEIRQNQIDLEQLLYDTFVEKWKREIEEMTESMELVKEANQDYVSGLKDSLSKEKELYSQDQSDEEINSLQRQLALLRRSGGSASEINDLEEQLNSALKDDYFASQEKMIQSISDANEEQIRKLEDQIRLQEEALEYQQEQGVIWSKVYELMQRSQEEIMAFLTSNNNDFLSRSGLGRDVLGIEWAKMIGIYKEDQVIQAHASQGKRDFWDTDAVWAGFDSARNKFSSLSSADQNTLRDFFGNVYGNARAAGKTEQEAFIEARDALLKNIEAKSNAAAAQSNKAPTGGYSPSSGGSSSGSGGGSGGGGSGSGNSYANNTVTITVDSAGGGTANIQGSSSIQATPGKTYRISCYHAAGYEYDHITYNGASKKDPSITPSGQVSSIHVIAYFKKKVQWAYNKPIIKEEQFGPGYAEGGLVDFTGPAMVHGSKQKPESFLNAEQTAQIREALLATGSTGALSMLRSTAASLQAAASSIKNNDSHNVTVEQGAINIQVGQLADSYDVDDLSNDVMDRIINIASKATNRGVSRRK